MANDKMAFKFFTVPIQSSAAVEAELNRFLSNHKVLSVDRRWVDQGATSFWSFCVDYLDAPAGGSTGRASRERNKVDYREVLSPEDFAVFAKLRDFRKEIAQPDENCSKSASGADRRKPVAAPRLLLVSAS